MSNELHKPVLEGKGATDYERYLRTDELLSLQTATEDLSHPDEFTFQVVHQRRSGTRQRFGFAGISFPAARYAQDRRRVSGTTG